MTYQEKDATSANVHTETLNGSDMRFVMIENLSNAESSQKDSGSWEHRFTVAALPVDDSLAIASNVNPKGGYRNVYYRREPWKGLLKEPEKISDDNSDAYKVGKYGLDDDGKNLKEFTYNVKDYGDTYNYYVSIRADDGQKSFSDPGNKKKLLPITFTGSYRYLETEIEKVSGGNAVLSAKRLSGETVPWYRHWELLADERPISEEPSAPVYPYKYYITEESVTDRIKETKYRSRYYAAADHEASVEIEPVTKTFRVNAGTETHEEMLTLYQLQNAESISTVKIVNTPLIDLNINKLWLLHKGNGSSIEAQEPEEIVITIYRGRMSAPNTEVKDIAEYGTVTFTPLVDTDTGKYNETYRVKINGGPLEGDLHGKVDEIIVHAGAVNETTVKKIAWEYTLSGLPLYDEKDGSQYQYYAVEGPLTKNDDLGVFYSTEDRKFTATVDGKDTILYPFEGAYPPENETGVMTLGIENRIPPIPFMLQLEKIDSDDNTKHLQGAEFKLESKRDSQPDSAYEVIATGTTDAQGHINFDLKLDEFKNLASYKLSYRLVETKAPEGYDLVETPIIFEFIVNEDGSLDLPDENIGQGAPSAFYRGYKLIGPDETGNKTNQYLLQITLANKNLSPPVSLPNSGGGGTGLFIVLGGLLIMFAAVALIYKRQRRLAVARQRIEHVKRGSPGPPAERRGGHG